MNNKNESQLVVLGSCRKPHGIKGAFSFFLESRVESVLEKGSKIFLRPLDSSSSISCEGEWHTLSRIQLGNKLIAYLKGVDNRNQVEAMIPFSIEMDRKDFPDLPEGEFYFNDIIGLKVFDAVSLKEIGVVKGVYDNGAQNVLSISGKTSFDVPWVDAFIKEIDIESGVIKVIVPEF